MDISEFIKNFIDNGNKSIIPYQSIGNALTQSMMGLALADLGDVNKRLPDVDPFATPYNQKPNVFSKFFSFGKFATGGVVGNDAEVEGGEIIKYPNGTSEQVSGPNHEQGGVDKELPTGTKIFSKRVIVDGKTMVEREKHRNKLAEKFAKRYLKDPYDFVNRNTYERTQQVNNMQEYYDVKFQDMINNAYNLGLISQPSEAEQHKYGGIHIKKENRGKFTSYCKSKGYSGVTSKCIQEGLKSKDPTIRKRANFARNARKWKHQYGGESTPDGDPTKKSNPWLDPMEYNWQSLTDMKKMYTFFTSLPEEQQKTLFEGFTTFYKEKTGRDYPQTFENFIGKIGEANSYIEKAYKGEKSWSDYYNSYAQTYDVDNSGQEISTIPNLGAFFGSDTYKQLYQKYVTPQNTGTTQDGTGEDNNPTGDGGNPDKTAGEGGTGTGDGGDKTGEEGIKKEDEKPITSADYAKEQLKYYKPSTYTVGDILGIGATIGGPLAQAGLTLLNRLGDTKNINFYKTYGDEAKYINDQTSVLAAKLTESAARDIALSSQTSYDRNRMAARTINVQRALDTTTHMQTLKAKEELERNLLSTMMQLSNQRQQISMQSDLVRRQGAEKADLANRQDRDAFFTNLGQDLAFGTTSMQHLARTMNQELHNRVFLNLLPSLTANGIGVYVNPITGETKYYVDKGAGYNAQQDTENPDKTDENSQ